MSVALISSKNSTPGLESSLGKKAGGHQTACLSTIAGIPRKSVGSSNDARRSITGIPASLAIV